MKQVAAFIFCNFLDSCSKNARIHSLDDIGLLDLNAAAYLMWVCPMQAENVHIGAEADRAVIPFFTVKGSEYQMDS